MPAVANTRLKKLTRQYFIDNRSKFSRIYDMAKQFKIDTNEKSVVDNLAKYYFRPLFKEALQGKEIIDDSREEITVEENEDNKIIHYKGEKSITSLEEAIKFFEIDLKIWEVESWKCKSWDTSMNIKRADGDKTVSEPIKRTNYSVNINLKKRVSGIDYEKIITNIDELYSNYPIIKSIQGSNIGVVTVADIHIGLKVTKKGGIINTPEFNLESIIRYLNEVAERTNSLKYEEVHLVILGDLVESVSGYNHIETLKEMESTITGGNIIILAYEIISKFVAKIKNLKKVYLISGNHDRLTPLKEMDKDGGACQLVAYMLKNIVDVEWHPFLISKVIDDINYVLTHGHLKISIQDIGKIFFEYGDQSRYNVMLSGHWHVRKSMKVFAEKNLYFADTSKYRAITVPPIISGTRWTEENGWSCAPGFIVSEANSSKSNIHLFDYALN